MKYFIILIIGIFSYNISFSQGNLSKKTETIKLAQVDIYVDTESFKFEVTKVPSFKTDDEVLEVIFMLYVLENKESEILKKVKELYRSGWQAAKPTENKSEIIKL